MPKSNNLVVLTGHLGADPELGWAGDARLVRLRLATNFTWRSQSGEKRERTDWHNIDVFRASADFAYRFLCKGDLVQVFGYLRQESRPSKADPKEMRRYTNVVAQDVNLLTGLGERVPRDLPATPSPSPAQRTPNSSSANVDALPF